MVTKAEKSIRLGESRVSDVIKKLRLVANLSNTNNYEYSEEQVKEMLDTIQWELNKVKAAYEKSIDVRRQAFTFKNKNL